MYAVIATGGKQYRVAKGDVISVEKLPLEAGASVEFGQVLMLGEGEQLTLGAPYVQGGKVSGKVLAQERGEKILITKFRRRKHYRKTIGHRQHYTKVEITDIVG
jgi:large subunit ribosomal protein L21